MLYNRAAKEATTGIARSGIRLRSGIDSRRAGRKRADSCRRTIWLVTREEVFADRGYQGRRFAGAAKPGALIENEEQALAQTLEMVQYGRVKVSPANGQ
ncbi:hypothetical protein DMI70_12715 [Escherichia coli]|nr:hypothetical protein [Escherichia coli]